MYIDCDKRGQTSRPVVGSGIQTSCNFKANLLDRYYLLGCTHGLFTYVFLESCNDLQLWYGIVITVLCLLTSIFSYTMIFLNLRHHQNQVQDHVQQPNQANPLHIERYKKAVSTAIWLQLTLIACYLPNIIALSLITKRGLSSSTYHVWNYAISLLFLNSSLNPILYCWKIEEIRQAVKNTIRQVLCHCFPC